MQDLIYLENPPEMERLLRKYSGGRVPPLIGHPGSEGLLSHRDEEFLNIYLAGMSSRYNVKVRMCPLTEAEPETAGNSYQKPGTTMETGQCFLLNELKKKKTILEKLPLRCCFQKQKLICHNGSASIVMCCLGMITIGIPIIIFDIPIGILLTECRKPSQGHIWKAGLVDLSMCDIPSCYLWKDIERSPELFDTQENNGMMDLWEESKYRVHLCERALFLEDGELLAIIDESLKNGKLSEIAPGESLDMMIQQLSKASEHLSDILMKTYKIEKESLVGWIRAEMASALSSVEGFWSRIQWHLGNLIRLMGLDYILLVSTDPSGSLKLQCQYGLPKELTGSLEYGHSTSQQSNFFERIKSDRVVEVNLKQFRRVPILGAIYSFYGKGTDYPVLISSVVGVDGTLTFLLMGKRNPFSSNQNNRLTSSINGWMCDWLNPNDYQYLSTITRELNIITRVYSSIKRIQDEQEQMTDIVELLAHDLKTPINNIMVAADNLRNARTNPERASRTITGVVTQLERLNLLAEKVWMLEQIKQNSLTYNDSDDVDIYDILVECANVMADLAESKSITIEINPEIKNWKGLSLDSEKFRLVVTNLIQNGVKYSYNNTTIKVSGWESLDGVCLDFSNIGIPIHEAEKDRIFDKYFRSKEARRLDPSGSGIGLVLVKEFVNHYNGRIDVQSNEIEFGKYLNVFSLYIPKKKVDR